MKQLSDSGPTPLETTASTGFTRYVSTVGRAISSQECLALLRTVSLGRVALSVGALPMIYPVRFGVRDIEIVIAVDPASQFGRAIDGSIVAFEADSFNQQHDRGWSVVAVGRAERIDDGEHRAAVLGPETSGALRTADRLVRIPLEIVSGHVIQDTGGPCR
jgi:nitroimidazol reductase NimA-like FMN-containing flavoprotein (pyridoxamine 5'-phosphate oxidase superfamily)